MAIGATLSIPNAAAVNQTFEVLKTLPNGIDRIRTGSSVTEPEILAIRQQSFPAKGDKIAYDRRNVSFSNSQVDPDTGKSFVLTASMSLTIPRTAVFTATDTADAASYVRWMWLTHLVDLTLGKS